MIHFLALLLLPTLAGMLTAAAYCRHWRAFCGVMGLLVVGLLGTWQNPGAGIAQSLNALGSVGLMIAALLTLVGMELGQKLLKRKVSLP